MRSNNSFKPKPLRGSLAPYGFKGGFGLILALGVLTSMLDLIEKLINEHGSSSILRERLGLLKAECEALERKNLELESHARSQLTELQQLRSQVTDLQRQLSHKSGAFARYVCDHCGNSDLIRIGNKKDPIFGDLGAKLYVFRCNACKQESEFAQDP